MGTKGVAMARPWPFDTLEKLREAGYKYQDASLCSEPGCGKIIYWFITPKLKRMPFVIIPGPERDSVPHYQPHFVDCVGAKRFSRSGGYRAKN
jgi:hypothetical protein